MEAAPATPRNRAGTAIEWIAFVLLLAAIWPVTCGVTAKVSHRAGNAAFCFAFGILHLCCSHVLTDLYNRGVPSFLAFWRVNPRRVRIIGLAVVALGVAKLYGLGS